MSQHNIIGSEAFEGKRYIIVRKFRSGIGHRRRRRSAIVMFTVAVLALIVGALVAFFALAPLMIDHTKVSQLPMAPAAEVATNGQSPLGLQPVPTASEQAANAQAATSSAQGANAASASTAP